jgi:hypothetical protein
MVLGGRTFNDVLITYSAAKGVRQLLELRMQRHRASKWKDGINEILKQMPRLASPAHWRWSLSCMAATSRLGATGFLRQNELRSLLRRANATARLRTDDIEMAIKATDMDEKQLALPVWLRAMPVGGGHRHVCLDTRRTTGLLLRLAASSRTATSLFAIHCGSSSNQSMKLADWLSFVRVEQLASSNEAEQRAPQFDPERHMVDDDELSQAEQRFAKPQRSSSDASPPDLALSALDFTLQLLSPENDAQAPAARKDRNDLHEPFALYWTPASHNSYIVGDQLTGRSTAEAYRRHLLQVSRCRPLRQCRAELLNLSRLHPRYSGLPPGRDRLLGRSKASSGQAWRHLHHGRAF